MNKYGNLLRRLEITRYADTLLHRAKIKSPAISTDIIHLLNPEIGIFAADLGSVGSSLKITKLKSGHQAAIYFNAKQAIVRQRFSIMHEYGHYILHHLKLLDNDDSNQQTLVSKREMENEADIFASSMLVSLVMLNNYCPIFDYKPDKKAELAKLSLKLASQFNVSKACMNKSLFQLYHLRKSLGY